MEKQSKPRNNQETIIGLNLKLIMQAKKLIRKYIKEIDKLQYRLL